MSSRLEITLPLPMQSSKAQWVCAATFFMDKPLFAFSRRPIRARTDLAHVCAASSHRLTMRAKSKWPQAHIHSLNAARHSIRTDECSWVHKYFLLRVFLAMKRVMGQCGLIVIQKVSLPLRSLKMIQFICSIALSLLNVYNAHSKIPYSCKL